MGQSSSSRRRRENNPPLTNPIPSQLLSSSTSSTPPIPNPLPSLPPPPPPAPPSFAFAANAPYPSPPYPPPPISYPPPPPPPPFFAQYNHFSTPPGYAAPAPNRFGYPYFPFRPSSSQALATQPSQPLPYVEHQKATTVRNAVNVHKDTIQLAANEQDPDLQLVLFTFDALVDGR